MEIDRLAAESGQFSLGSEPQRAILNARFKLRQLSAKLTSKDLLQAFLDEAEALTSSKIGFFHFVEEDQKTLFLQTWSTKTLTNMCKAEGAGNHYPVDEAGVWVDAVRAGKTVIHNDYASLPHKKGLPEGHAPILRELVVPIFRNEKMVAILGVGNKETEYSNSDSAVTEEFADLAWDIISKKRLEEEKHQADLALMEVLKESSDGIWSLNVITGEMELDERSLKKFGLDATQKNLPVQDILIFIVPEDRRSIEASFAELKNGTLKSFSQDFRLQQTDGSVRWFHGHGQVFSRNEKQTVLRIIGTFTDITQQKETQNQLQQTQRILQAALDQSSAGIAIADAPDGKLRYVNDAGLLIRGSDRKTVVNGVGVDQYVSKWQLLDLDGRPLGTDEVPLARAIMFGETCSREFIIRRPAGDDRIVSANAAPIKGDDGKVQAGIVVFTDITEHKRAEEVLQKKLVALTQPLETRAIAFDELFNLADVQRLQDEFAKATGVASIITTAEGIPLTSPSNFTRLCRDIIRKNEKGCANCFKSDAILGRYNPDGPIIQPCLSGGLWDAGAGIVVGGQHIANWLIGQVRDETQAEETMRAYAQEIGADEVSVVEAFREVPAMTRHQFGQIAQSLFTLANQLSNIAYQNIQQARFINERNQAEEKNKSLTQRLLLATSSARLGVWDWNVRENQMFWDDRMFELYGVTREETPNNIDAWLNGLHPADKDTAVAACQGALNGEKEYDPEFRVLHPDGTVKHLKANGLVIFGADGKPDRMLGINQDITDQKRAEEEKIKLETQLQQAQKIESIGHLAGGVAHDFNNMLGVILGHTELALMKADPSNPFVEDLEEIRTAAKRSADLTRQLLTFARKQIISPKVLDLNDTVAGMLKMLQRLIGENIHLSWNPAANLWPVKMDPSQLDQILANLCVNARDAIAGIGKITIETQNYSFTESDQKDRPDSLPGDYVRLSVSDDGHGIDKEIMPQIFEPFFTTKEFGQGTGLGLSTVFGAVKQNHGFIEVASEPAQGTTFHIYLPRKQATVAAVPEAATKPLHQGTETVLLVEDDQMLLKLSQTMLEKSGYTVLAAATVDRAISLAKEHPGQIHLLLSDLIMPELNGRDLWDILQVFRPEMKVVFMSGYTADIIAKQGVVEEGVNFLQKPVSFEALTSKVREVLD